MNELISINYDNEQPTVLGRDLHEALEIKTAYKDWFPRMCEYGFEEGKDFCSFLSESTGGRRNTDHQITIPMAKEICMIQRSDIGRQFRQYFIKVEEQWNTPEAIMARALQMANNKINSLKMQNSELFQMNKLMQPKAYYYDKILSPPGSVPITLLAKDYGMSGKKMNKLLVENKIQYKIGDTYVLYQNYADKEYTETITRLIETQYGDKAKVQTRWTQKGREFIYHYLKEKGIVPVCEK